MTVTRLPLCRPIDVPGWARRAAASDGAVLTTVVIRDATALDADELRAAVRDAYREAFDAGGNRHVVRAWNVLPDIHARLGEGDRYIAFNAGRADAMRERYGDRFAARVPAATGVGGAGDDVSIHLLATREPGEPLENPRQTPAFRYSEKFGPLPPCFARATRATIDGRPLLLVSGTAAIVGEETHGDGDVRAQGEITLRNLRALLTADGDGGSLDRFEDVRVYLPSSTFDDRALRASIRRAFACCGSIEFVRADLCRRELLIEIEGVATPGVGGPT